MLGVNQELRISKPTTSLLKTVLSYGSNRPFSAGAAFREVCIFRACLVKKSVVVSLVVPPYDVESGKQARITRLGNCNLASAKLQKAAYIRSERERERGWNKAVIVKTSQLVLAPFCEASEHSATFRERRRKRGIRPAFAYVFPAFFPLRFYSLL